MVVSPNKWNFTFLQFSCIWKLIHHQLVSDLTMKPTFFRSSFPWGLESLHGVFRVHASMARWQSQPVGKTFCWVWQSKPRALDTLEQQNSDTLATILLVFLRKSVKFVDSKLWKCMLNCWALHWNFTLNGNVWSFKLCKNCSNIAFCLGDAATQHCVFTVQSPCTHKWKNFSLFYSFCMYLKHFDVISLMKHRK